MGLLTIIKKQKLKDKELRILILGLDNSGKSTILNSLLGNDSTNLKPTMGFEISSLIYNSYNLNFWDIGGQYSLRSFWSNFFNGSVDAIVFVISLVDLDRIQESIEQFHRLIVQNEQVGDVKVLIFLNKIDLFKGSLPQVKQSLRKAIGDRYNFHIQECCGLTGEHLTDGVDWVIESLSV